MEFWTFQSKIACQRHMFYFTNCFRTSVSQSVGNLGTWDFSSTLQLCRHSYGQKNWLSDTCPISAKLHCLEDVRQSSSAQLMYWAPYQGPKIKPRNMTTCPKADSVYWKSGFYTLPERMTRPYNAGRALAAPMTWYQEYYSLAGSNLYLI